MIAISEEKPERPFVGIREAAKRLHNTLAGRPGMLPQRVRQLIASGALPAFSREGDVFGQWYVYEDEIEAYNQRVKGEKPPAFPGTVNTTEAAKRIWNTVQGRYGVTPSRVNHHIASGRLPSQIEQRGRRHVNWVRIEDIEALNETLRRGAQGKVEEVEKGAGPLREAS